MTPDDKFRNGFYTVEDFYNILTELRRTVENFKQNKHTMDIIQLLDARADLAILNSQLADIGADLLHERLATATSHRKQLLEKTEEYENQFYTDPINPVSGKKWTNIDNRARYKAELEAIPLKEAENEARKIHARAYFLYANTIPDVLNAMASRINVLIRDLPVGTTKDDKDQATPMPSTQRYGKEDDGFGLWDVHKAAGRSFDELESALEEDRIAFDEDGNEII